MASDDVSPELRRALLSGFSLALGGANVIMQLSRLPVGRGIVESTVASGSLHRHPLKRTRTTLSYIMVALLGTDHERAVMRREVNRQHRQVRSRDDSAVAYDAFNPELQLWVAACMYRGAQDALRTLYRDAPEGLLDELYELSVRFATTLQVPEERWPSDRAAFEHYWNDALTLIAVDDETRAFLYGLASLDFLPRPLSTLFGVPHRFITTGFLPPPFRELLGLSWGPRRQWSFEWLCRIEAALNRVAPRAVREFPWNMYLYDVRRRIRRGRAIV